MWCAYVFAALAIYGAPGEIKAVGFPTWFAQSFLQLVLLSVIMVGQKVQAQMTIELHSKVDEVHKHVRLQGTTSENQRETPEAGEAS